MLTFDIEDVSDVKFMAPRVTAKSKECHQSITIYSKIFSFSLNFQSFVLCGFR
jgi:hypothetical protein